MSTEEIQKMFDLVDSDHSGFIDYSEFVVAAISDKALTSPEKLQLAFKMFDRDGSGVISAIEIIDVLGMDAMKEKELVEKVLAEVDSNGDGEISFDEFCTMMKNL
jgi:calcium-dependent protein kinase